VGFLAFNHRRAPFADKNVRLALSLAVDRKGLVERHFGGDIPGAVATTLNGLFPRGSWANSPATRVPEELYRPDDARANARKALKDLGKVKWTLKYPDGDARLDAAFKDLAAQITKVLTVPGVEVAVLPMRLSPRELQTALRNRDFDLIYQTLDFPDSPQTLWPLFDPHPDSVAAGGSNFLGYDQDAPLQGWLRSALHHRHFPAVQNLMQTTHAHLYETMPLIPLWQLPYAVALHSKLRGRDFEHGLDIDPLAVFGNVLEWRLTP
jgi:ABC-type oligopeptide transport system substrate-binding subunit